MNHPILGEKAREGSTFCGFSPHQGKDNLQIFREHNSFYAYRSCQSGSCSAHKSNLPSSKPNSGISKSKGDANGSGTNIGKAVDRGISRVFSFFVSPVIPTLARADECWQSPHHSVFCSHDPERPPMIGVLCSLLDSGMWFRSHIFPNFPQSLRAEHASQKIRKRKIYYINLRIWDLRS